MKVADDTECKFCDVCGKHPQDARRMVVTASWLDDTLNGTCICDACVSAAVECIAVADAEDAAKAITEPTNG